MSWRFVGKFFLACLAVIVALLSITGFQSNYNPPPAAATQFRQGSATPATCHAPQVFMVVSAGAGTPYYCSAANTWTAFGTGGGSVTSVSGTANQIDVATGTTTPVISFDVNALSNLGGLPLTGGTMSGLLNVAWTPSDSNVITANNLQTATFPRTVDELCSNLVAIANCEKDFGRARSANNVLQMLFGYAGSGSSSNNFALQFFGGSSVFGVTAAGTMASKNNTLDNGSGNMVLAGSFKVAASRKGTFVCTNGGSIVVANANEIATSDVIISMNTPGGTITTPPAMKTLSANTSFTVLCGATDTSTYNYDILN